MSFEIRCNSCGNRRKLDDGFIQLGHVLDVYAKEEGKLIIDCDRCKQEVKTENV